MSPVNTQDIERRLELEKERLKILRILKRHGHRDLTLDDNFVTDFPDTATDMMEVEDEVFEDTNYEVDLDVEHVLEERLKKIEEELARS